MSRSPDYNFRAMDKVTDEKGRIGAAWSNPDGSITVALDFRVVIEGKANMVYTLFPNNKKEQA